MGIVALILSGISAAAAVASAIAAFKAKKEVINLKEQIFANQIIRDNDIRVKRDGENSGQTAGIILTIKDK